MSEELDIVNEAGDVIGRRAREECHADPSLIHRVVHVLVFNRRGDIFLQQRAESKDIQPGKWDTSAAGHLAVGEDFDPAAKRELAEELGITARPKFLYDYVWRTDRETELVRTYRLIHDGPFRLHPTETSDGRFWSPEEVQGELGRETFTPNFELEWRKCGGPPGPVP